MRQVLSCTSKRRKAANLLSHLALASGSVGAASGTDAGPSLAGSLGAARLPTRRRAAMAPPQRLPLLGCRPGAAKIGAPSHRLQHPRGTTVLPAPPRPANSIRRAVVNAAPLKCCRPEERKQTTQTRDGRRTGPHLHEQDLGRTIRDTGEREWAKGYPPREGGSVLGFLAPELRSAIIAITRNQRNPSGELRSRPLSIAPRAPVSVCRSSVP